MNRQLARQQCEALVRSLDLPRPFDLAELCARLGAQRGRPIVLMPTPMTTGSLCGMWLGTAQGDYVFYEQDTTRLHQQHIVCHEIGHILRRHPPTRVLDNDIARALAPQIDAGEVQRVLGRDTYSDDAEFEAELIASLILRRVAHHPAHETPRASRPDAQAVIERIARSLSGDGPRTPPCTPPAR